MAPAFSAGVRLSNISDFIAPSQNCIVTNPGLPSSQGFVQTRREVAPGEAVKVTLHDCLACSGCVTTAESVMLEQQSVEEFLQHLAPPARPWADAAAQKGGADQGGACKVVVSVSPQSRAALAAHFRITPLQALGKLTTFLKSLGVAEVLDTSSSRDVALVEVCREFIQRYRATYQPAGAAEMQTVPPQPQCQQPVQVAGEGVWRRRPEQQSSTDEHADAHAGGSEGAQSSVPGPPAPLSSSSKPSTGSCLGAEGQDVEMSEGNSTDSCCCRAGEEEEHASLSVGLLAQRREAGPSWKSGVGRQGLQDSPLLDRSEPDSLASEAGGRGSMLPLAHPDPGPVPERPRQRARPRGHPQPVSPAMPLLAPVPSAAQPLLPLLSSACPGWVCYAEKRHGEDILGHLSRVKSPQQIMGALLKRTQLGSNLVHTSPEGMYHVTVMPCYDKKLEALRPDFHFLPSSSEEVALGPQERPNSAVGPTGEECAQPMDVWPDKKAQQQHHIQEVDCVLTSGELFSLIEEKCPDFAALEESPLLALLTCVDQEGQLLGVPGGSGSYAETVLRTAAHELFGIIMPEGPLEWRQLRNADMREYALNVDGRDVLKVACAYGFHNIQNIVRRARTGKLDYHFVEVMACPGGCLSGGGQPKPRPGQSLKSHLLELEMYYLKEVRMHDPFASPLVMEVFGPAGASPSTDSSVLYPLLHTSYHSHLSPPPSTDGLAAVVPPAALANW